MHLVHRFAISTLALFTLGTAVSETRAQGPPALYGVAHIGNNTDVKATIFFKWGTNWAWGRRVIEPGKKWNFPWTYDGGNKMSPDLYVRLDVDFKGGGTKYVEYKLSRGGSPDSDSAKYGHHFSIKPVDKGSDIRYVEKVTSEASAIVTDANATKPDVK
jgi:hypothetical protein